jgi:hypothetical protein
MSEVVRESLRNSNTAMDILNRVAKTYIHRYLLLALKSGRSFVFDFPWVAYVNGQRADVRMRIRNNKVSLSFERDNTTVYETEEYDNLHAFSRLYKEYAFDSDTLLRTKVGSMLDKMVEAGFDRKINPDDIRSSSSFF